jgi:hypothetical protein
MDNRKLETAFTVGYRSDPMAILTTSKPQCPKCNGWMEVVTNTFTNKKGEVITTPEGDCLQCGFHVWNLKFQTKQNPSGVTNGAFEDAKDQKDPILTPEGLDALEIVTKVQKVKRVSKVVRQEGMSTLDRLLFGI